jgi:hypothetical protein
VHEAEHTPVLTDTSHKSPCGNNMKQRRRQTLYNIPLAKDGPHRIIGLAVNLDRCIRSQRHRQRSRTCFLSVPTTLLFNSGRLRDNRVTGPVETSQPAHGLVCFAQNEFSACPPTRRTSIVHWLRRPSGTHASCKAIQPCLRGLV